MIARKKVWLLLNGIGKAPLLLTYCPRQVNPHNAGYQPGTYSFKQRCAYCRMDKMM